MDESQRPSIFEANTFYLFLAIVFINIGGIVQGLDEIKGLLFTEYIIILLPSLLFVIIKKIPGKKFLKLNRISLKQVLLVIIITIFTYPLAVFVQGIFLTILSSFTEFVPNNIPAATDTKGFLYGLFAMSISAGICEEVMFRGVILNTYNKLGYKKSIFITAALFAMFHFTLVNFIGPFILGIVFGIMVYRTNSIYSSIIAHGVNNAIALGILYFVNKYSEAINSIVEEESNIGFSGSDIIPMIIGLIFLTLCFLIVKKSLKSLGDMPKDKYKMEFGEVELHKEKFNPIKYFPIWVVITIFLYINLKYILTLYI